MIAIIGGGITALCLGEYLKRKEVDFQLFEGSNRVGGNINSVEEADYLLEKGPNSLRMNDHLYALVEELGLVDDLLYSEPAAKFRFILRNGRYQQLPTGIFSFLFNSFFSWKTKRKIWRERKLMVKGPEYETVDAFFRRRFGDEVTDYAVYPFISGIYAGDPSRLIAAKAFPQLVKFEREYGSVIQGMMKGREKQQHTGIVSFKGGLSRLTNTLAKRIQAHVQLSSPLLSIKRQETDYLLQFPEQEIQAEQVVFCIPAHPLAKLLQNLQPDFSQALASVHYPSVAITYTAYKRNQVEHPVNGFGALHNVIEPSNTLGTIFSSSVFTGRCPDDEVLLTTFAGGSRFPERYLADDDAMAAAVREDLERFLGAKGNPVYQTVARYPKAIPQYDANILPIQAELPKLSQKGLYFGGNWVGGISVLDCIKHAGNLSDAISIKNS